MSYSLGIDPGWSSCGYALTNTSTGELLVKGNFIPKESGNIKDAVDKLCYLAFQGVNLLEDDLEVYIERFVAYKGVVTTASEDILMFIGGLVYAFQNAEAIVRLVRAIEWKPALNKWLVRRKGFSNPYPSFNKKYSLLAASTLSGVSSPTDHEADAICLSYLYNFSSTQEKA